LRSSDTRIQLEKMNREHDNDDIGRLTKRSKMIVRLIDRWYSVILLFDIENILFQRISLTHTHRFDY
jgi:hypothetical protein